MKRFEKLFALCIIIIIIITIISIFYSIYIKYDKNNHEPKFLLTISNTTNNTEEIKLIIINSIDGEIFNITIIVESKEVINIYPVDKIKGSYTINAYIDENRTMINEPILIANYTQIHIMIYENDLLIRTKIISVL